MLSGWFKRRLPVRATSAPGVPVPGRVQPAADYRLRQAAPARPSWDRLPEVRRKVTIIFPLSPLLQLRDPKAKEAAAKATVANRWRTPLRAGGAVLTTVVVALLLYEQFFRDGPTPGAADRARAETLAGRQALEKPAFAQAAEHFRKARELGRDDLSEAQLRWLEQAQKQAALMADLSSQSLTEMLQSHQGASDEEWRQRYANKPLIFDALVHSAGGGVHRLDYTAFSAGHPVWIEIRGSKLLRSLPVEWPTRLVLGVRLAETRRDPRGNWIVLADPENLVLFTEPAMLSGAWAPVDATLADQLRRQAEWPGLRFSVHESSRKKNLARRDAQCFQ